MQRSGTDVEAPARGLPSLRIGAVAGLAGMLCCVGPTVLALLGVVGAGTAYVWAENLYDGYAWWFRLGALLVLVALVAWVLRRRGVCTLDGARSAWRSVAIAVGAAVVSYAALYALTAWLGTFA